SIYTHLGVTPLWLVIAINIVLFMGISSRMISSQALISAVPTAESRGAFMSVSSSVQQVSGGIAAILAGMIVIQTDGGPLLHFDILGYVVIGTTCITVAMMYFLNRYLKGQAPHANTSR
ncbi:MFS transporter, partial [bacterium]|nr:MFS transporter [bacterium]